MRESDVIWLVESPVTMVAGEQIAFSVDWQGAARVSDPEAYVYRNGADITAEVMTSDDSHQVSGNVVTLKKLSAGLTHGGGQARIIRGQLLHLRERDQANFVGLAHFLKSPAHAHVARQALTQVG